MASIMVLPEHLSPGEKLEAEIRVGRARLAEFQQQQERIRQLLAQPEPGMVKITEAEAVKRGRGRPPKVIMSDEPDVPPEELLKD